MASVADIVSAHGDLKRIGDEHHGPCRICGAGKDRFWVREGNTGAPLLGCRQCDASFTEHLVALGIVMTNGAGRQEWTCTGPDGSRKHYRVDKPDGSKDCPWEQLPKIPPRRLMYAAGAAAGETVIVVEGEKSADAAARLFPGWRILGTCQGAPKSPDRDVLAWHLGGAVRVALWPDNDTVGINQMRGIQESLPDGIDVRWINPAALVDAPKQGWDVADWRPQADAFEAFKAALIQTPPDEHTGRRGAFIDGDSADLRPERRPEWVIHGLIPKRSVTIVSGEGGEGKSAAMLSLMAEHEIRIAWCGLEDDLDSITRPRYRVAGGKMDHVVWFDSPTAHDIDEAFLTDLEHKVVERRLQAVVFDTLAAWHPDAELNETKLIRRFTDTMMPLADRTGLAIIVIHHLRKAGSTDPRHRVAGSHQVVAAARSVILVLADPDDPHRKIMAHAKTNYGARYESQVFRIEDAGGEDEGVARVLWDGTDPRTAEDLSRIEASEKDKTDSDVADAETLIGLLRTALETPGSLDKDGVTLDTVATFAIRNMAEQHTDEFEQDITKKGRVVKLLRLAKGIRFSPKAKSRFPGHSAVTFVYKEDVLKA